MTFKDIQDELVNLRFGEGRRASIKLWINQSYQSVWAQADWPFKKVEAATLAVTSGAQPTSPTDLGRVLSLYDDIGNRLDYLAPKDFDDSYRYQIGQSQLGRPQAYTVVNGSILLGPLPSATASYTLNYERALCHYVSGGALTTGGLSSDTDYPIFPSNYHYMLVFGAMQLGLQLINDPTFPPLQQTFQALLGDMKAELLPPDQPENASFDRDQDY